MNGDAPFGECFLKLQPRHANPTGRTGERGKFALIKPDCNFELHILWLDWLAGLEDVVGNFYQH